jgi:co-chaperonin GroES (HSP10)
LGGALLRDLVRREPAVTVGDDVLFNHDAGQQITLENQRYIILHEHEVIAVVVPEEEPCLTN